MLLTVGKRGTRTCSRMSPGMRSTIIAIPVGPLPDAIPESIAEAYSR